jgi:hypothetical protein
VQINSLFACHQVGNVFALEIGQILGWSMVGYPDQQMPSLPALKFLVRPSYAPSTIHSREPPLVSGTMDDVVRQKVLIQRLGITVNRRERLRLRVTRNKRATAFKEDLWFVGELEALVYLIA